MLPFRTFTLATVAALVLSGAHLIPAAAAPRLADDDLPADTTQVADRQLFFETNLGLIERATAEAVDQTLEGLKLPPGSDILLHSVTSNEGAWFVEDFIAKRLNQRGYNVHVPKEIVPGQPASISPSSPAAGTLSAATAAGGPPSLSDATRAAEKPNAGASAGADSVKSGSTDPAAPPGLTDALSSTAKADTTGTSGRPGPRGRSGPTGLNAAKAGPGGRANEEPEQLIPVPEGQGLVLTIRLVEFGVTYHDSWRRGFMGPRLVERLASVNLYCRLVSDGPQNVLWVGRGKSERLDVVPKSKLDLLEGLSYPFTRPTLRPERFSRLLEPVLVTGIIGGLVYLFYTNQK